MGQNHIFDENKIETLTTSLIDDKTLGLLLTGSHARGEATRYSDIDVFKFVTDLPPARDQHRVMQFEDKLLSLTATTVDAKLEEIKHPETAIWAVPGLRQSRILFDKLGLLTRLKQSAESFEWSALRNDADRWATAQMAGLAEEANKVVNSLQSSTDPPVYAALGLMLGLTKTVAVKLGVLIPTEDKYLRTVEEAVGTDSTWSAYHRAGYGLEGCSSVAERSVSALRLYIETSRLIEYDPASREGQIILHTTSRIEQTPLSNV